MLDLFARVVDVDADKVPVGIIVHHHPFRNFSALDTRLFRLGQYTRNPCRRSNSVSWLEISVQESIMDRDLVLQRDDPQVPAAKLRHDRSHCDVEPAASAQS
jgi:hypothetical protein